MEEARPGEEEVVSPERASWSRDLSLAPGRPDLSPAPREVGLPGPNSWKAGLRSLRTRAGLHLPQQRAGRVAWALPPRDRPPERTARAPGPSEQLCRGAHSLALPFPGTEEGLRRWNPHPPSLPSTLGYLVPSGTGPALRPPPVLPSAGFACYSESEHPLSKRGFLNPHSVEEEGRCQHRSIPKHLFIKKKRDTRTFSNARRNINQGSHCRHSG